MSLPAGSSRVFLEDGDVLSVSAAAPGEAGSVDGFGEVTSVVRAAGFRRNSRATRRDTRLDGLTLCYASP